MSDLTDLEVCKRIAEIEGVTIRDTGEDLEWVKCPKSAIEPKYDDYNPLTDDALCFQLMVKYQVNVIYEDDFVKCSAIIRGHLNVVGDNPNEAILLAIIEANSNE